MLPLRGVYVVALQAQGDAIGLEYNATSWRELHRLRIGKTHGPKAQYNSAQWQRLEK